MARQHSILRMSLTTVLCECSWVYCLDGEDWGIHAAKDKLLDAYNSHLKYQKARGK